jgi:hypothetical protein
VIPIHVVRISVGYHGIGTVAATIDDTFPVPEDEP